MKTFKFKKARRLQIHDFPDKPSIAPPEGEQLLGVVQGKEASAPEERMANALRKAGLPFEFRLVVGAPAKGLPGWKELDFLVWKGGVMFAVEVDTAFTHRNKEQKDKLHDAIILHDAEIRSMGQLWPEVIHANGDQELADNESALAYVNRRF